MTARLIEQHLEIITILRSWEVGPAGEPAPELDSWVEITRSLGRRVRSSFGTTDSSIPVNLTETVDERRRGKGRDDSVWTMPCCGGHSVQFEGTVRMESVFRHNRCHDAKAPT